MSRFNLINNIVDTFEQLIQFAKSKLVSNKKLVLKGNVLVIDDDDDFIFLMQQKLKRYQVSIDTASNFVQFKQMIETNTYDLILSDFNIGSKHGGHVIDYLIKKGFKIPFYFLSTYLRMIRPEIREKYLNKALGYLEKPLKDSDLETILKNTSLKMQTLNFNDCNYNIVAYR